MAQRVVEYREPSLSTVLFNGEQKWASEEGACGRGTCARNGLKAHFHNETNVNDSNTCGAYGVGGSTTKMCFVEESQGKDALNIE